MKRKLSQAAAWKLLFEELGETALKINSTGIWSDSYKDKERRLLLAFTDGNSPKRILAYVADRSKVGLAAANEAIYDMKKDLADEEARLVLTKKRILKLKELSAQFDDLDANDVEGS